MGREHYKNGFNYTHDRFNFGGQWVVYWRFKPQNSEIWCPFFIPSGKQKKADLEQLLKDINAATEYYDSWLKKASDVEAAQNEVRHSQEHYDRVSDPSWGGRGNNPNRDVRIIRDARLRLDDALRALEKAMSLRAKLNIR
ncbi:hypothetical protein [Pectobacterium aroidearum]|uniref:hypothetical protein n=1 Tax=Pectobacterium aroidearum TaxID=1201031 RepID=UPI002A7EE746|nr:hypothetical protein [Pectobacterium aroidearum]MDY4387885.1 hypothetical protein [Pectobacterium aroidearum]